MDTITPALSVQVGGTKGQNDWYVSNVSVTANATDTGSGVGLLEAKVDGGAWTVVNGPLSFSDGCTAINIERRIKRAM